MSNIIIGWFFSNISDIMGCGVFPEKRPKAHEFSSDSRPSAAYIYKHQKPEYKKSINQGEMVNTLFILYFKQKEIWDIAVYVTKTP